MRKTFLLIMTLLLSAAWAMAQASPSGPQSQTAPGSRGSMGSQGRVESQMPPDTAGPSQSIEGCLGGAAGTFTVTDKNGTSYQLLLPQSADTSKLSQHIGEEVQVTGAVSNAGAGGAASSKGEGSAGAGSAGSAAGGSSTQPAITVSKMSKIGDSCNAGVTNK